MHAPSIRLSGSLIRRYFTTGQLLLFMLALCEGAPVHAAWRQSGFPSSRRTAYRLRRRLMLCRSVLRSRLCTRAPPSGKECAGPAEESVFRHLQETVGVHRTISSYQETFQRDFLALT